MVAFKKSAATGRPLLLSLRYATLWRAAVRPSLPIRWSSIFKRSSGAFSSLASNRRLSIAVGDLQRNSPKRYFPSQRVVDHSEHDGSTAAVSHTDSSANHRLYRFVHAFGVPLLKVQILVFKFIGNPTIQLVQQFSDVL